MYIYVDGKHFHIQILFCLHQNKLANIFYVISCVLYVNYVAPTNKLTKSRCETVRVYILLYKYVTVFS